MIGLFPTLQLNSICLLNIGFWEAVLCGNIAFSILVLSTKKRYSSLLKQVFVFLKICFKVEILKTFKIFSDYHIKTCRSLKRRAILKIPSTVFRRTYDFSVGFKIKPPGQGFFCVKLKPKSNFAVKVAERSNRWFIVYLMNHLVKTYVLFNMWQWTI